MTSRPIEVLLHHFPTIVDRSDDEWTRNFARSILRQARNPRWRPSEKQLEIMQRLVADLLRMTDGFEVLE